MREYAVSEELRMRMLAVDMDGTLLGTDGQVSARNLAALKAAERAGVEVVVATGRRHCYAMRQLRALGLREESVVISSNGTVVRTIGARLLERALLPTATATWLCGHVEEFKSSLVITFDRVRPDGEDIRGALVVEAVDELNASVGRWMLANEPYIVQMTPIERALEGEEAPIQMMICGTVERMRRAEARLLEHPGVSGAGFGAQERAYPVEVSLHRTEYRERDLSILDILPAGCSKGAALLRLAADRGVRAEEIMAIGDNWNDVSMLEAVGQAVLMANAPEELKEVAAKRGWKLGLGHEEDGVAVAVEEALALAVTR